MILLPNCLKPTFWSLLIPDGFIEPAREEAQRAVDLGLSWKNSRPGRLLVVVGCYPERFPDYLKARYPQVDVWSGVRAFDRIDEIIESKKDIPRNGTFLLDHRTPRVISTGPYWAYVKIQKVVPPLFLLQHTPNQRTL